ncbi:hypothetical protein BUALT_Bualt18G0055400 [Buddleja alternifolia]|uniref:Uncharacterized protein n=1 Tax=Buddleja alternifolia TaxID=168488 RepID=A0AAV6WBA2_9LAMI|nr:hypothetical protein BUALT_Bualt18G0055400 [Buddleja alternifolia]
MEARHCAAAELRLTEVTAAGDGDVTPLKNAFATSNSYSSAAITKINKAVRNNAPSNLGQLILDDETKSKIGLSHLGQENGYLRLRSLHPERLQIDSWSWIINVIDPFFIDSVSYAKFKIGGGVAFSNILSKTLDEVKHEKTLAEKVDTPQKHSSGGRRLSDGAELPSWELVFSMI